MDDKLQTILERAKKLSLEDTDYLMEIVRMLHEEFGEAPPEALEAISEKLNVPLSRLYEIVTFYSLFTERREAKHVIRVCGSLPCHVSGGLEIIKAIKDELGIDFNQVTEDGMFKLESVGCLGRCDSSPNMMVDSTLYTSLTPEKVRSIIEAYRKGVI